MKVSAFCNPDGGLSTQQSQQRHQHHAISMTSLLFNPKPQHYAMPMTASILCNPDEDLSTLQSVSTISLVLWSLRLVICGRAVYSDEDDTYQR
jgi:hypothetical protein